MFKTCDVDVLQRTVIIEAGVHNRLDDILVNLGVFSQKFIKYVVIKRSECFKKPVLASIKRTLDKSDKDFTFTLAYDDLGKKGIVYQDVMGIFNEYKGKVKFVFIDSHLCYLFRDGEEVDVLDEDDFIGEANRKIAFYKLRKFVHEHNAV